MRIIDIFSVASSSLLRTRNRAALTMLGIVIGIASVIVMLSIGRSAEQFLLSQISSFGSDLVIVTNGRGDVSRGDPASQQLEKQTLTLKDYRSLLSQPWVRAANANLVSQDTVTYGSESVITSVYGSGPGEAEVYSSDVARGVFISDAHVDSRARIIVLGDGIAKKLFGETDPIGLSVKIGKRSYRVIGIMEQGGSRFFTDLDQLVYSPVTSAIDLYSRDRMNFIMFKPVDGLSVAEAQNRVRLLFRDTHNLNNSEADLSKDDFRVLSQEDAVRNAGVISTILQILLASIAGISLLVGGIGIMNITYVTVTERTSEIGLRKALGAHPEDILRQFLIEAILLTGAGGVIGIISGVLFTYLGILAISSYQDGWVFVLPIDGVILAFSVSAIIGITFGYFPARKAAHLDPIEALRYE